MPTKSKLIEVDAGTLAVIGKIRTFENDIKAFASRIKVIDEQLQEMMDGTSEYDDVLELQDKLKIAKDNLHRALMNKQGFNDLLEERGEENDALRSAKRNLSDFLLGYFQQTGERQIEIAPKQAREVILTGRLGKEKKFQTNLFTQNDTAG